MNTLGQIHVFLVRSHKLFLSVDKFQLPCPLRVRKNSVCISVFSDEIEEVVLNGKKIQIIPIQRILSISERSSWLLSCFIVAVIDFR